MGWFLKIYVIAIVFLESIICHSYALSISLSDMECVSEHVLHDGDTVSGNFVVMDHDIFWSSDHPGIDFISYQYRPPWVHAKKSMELKKFIIEPEVQRVTAPGGQVVHSLKGTSGDKFEFRASHSGIYKFCFHNPVSTPETVSFYIHIGHIPNEHDLAKDEHLDPINVKIAELREALEGIITEQKYLKARDARHRYTNESTRKRVVFYTILEYILFAATSLLQVVYIRRLFSKSFAYNRV